MEPSEPGDSAFTVTQQKWSEPVIAAGWTTVPNVLIEFQAELGLDPSDLNILLHLAARWWKPSEYPRVSKTTIAKAMKISSRTVQRRLAKLEERGLIARQRQTNPDGGYQGTTNVYHLGGLIAAMAPLARQLSRKRAEARRARTRRSRPTQMEEFR